MRLETVGQAFILRRKETHNDEVARYRDFRLAGRDLGPRYDACSDSSAGEHDHAGCGCLRRGTNADQRRMRRKDDGPPDAPGGASMCSLAGRRLRLVPIDAIGIGVRVVAGRRAH